MAQRKLQTEIDRTLKKVQEGVEQFESIFDKMNASTNSTQKDKCETDLKTQIKKLQRLRDQIKTWISSSEIKDKNQLLETRKLIETQMERFKALEKEMKTKAFSKEGLIQAAKLDPAEKAKMDTINWLSSMIDELARQVEASEAEIEVLAASSGKKRGKGPGGERIVELETLNERRKWHVGRMELIQRMVDNGGISVETVDGTKEDISYFVESNQEEDFEEDEGIYDELDLQEDDDLFNANDKDDVQSSHDSQSVTDDPPLTLKTRGLTKVDDDASTASGRERKVSLDDAPASPVIRKTPSKKTASETKSDPVPPIPKPNFSQQPMSSALKAGLPATQTATGPRPASTTTPLPAIRYAAAAAAAVAPSQPPPPSASAPPLSMPPADPSSHVPSPPTSIPVSASPVASSMTSPPSASLVSEPSAPPQPSVLAEQAPRSPAQPSAVLADPSNSVASPLIQPVQATQQAQPSSSSSMQQSARPASRSDGARLPNALADLVSSFENAKQRSSSRAGDIDQLHSALDASFQSLPHPQDAEKPRYYIPKNPYQTPLYYPQEPFAGFQDKDFYAKLDLDTLFYIFYYHANTYEQWLAARELKKQSWRFHKQYLTWFQRLSQPQAITDDYEQGMYIYFDWENSWCQRKKSDFRFEYRYLEEM